MKIGYLRQFQDNWYLIPDEKIKECDALLSIINSCNSEDWFIYADEFEKTFNRYYLVYSLESLKILI